jgi:hypothetical protein
MAEQFAYRFDVDALGYQDRYCAMPKVVDPHLGQARSGEDILELPQHVPLIKGRPFLRGENEIPLILPL